MWCLDRNITLQATQLAGTQNITADEEGITADEEGITADEESRVMKDRSDWKLCPQIFEKINTLLGPLQVRPTTS